MTSRADEFSRTVMCMHAAPYSEQFNNNVAKVFNYYVMRFPNPSSVFMDTVITRNSTTFMATV